MTKKEFIDFFDGCKFDYRNEPYRKIKEFIQSSGDAEVEALLGEECSDIEYLTVFNKGLDPRSGNLSKAQIAIQYVLVYEYLYNSYRELRDYSEISCGYFDNSIVWDIEFCMDEPNWDEVNAALLEISKSDVFTGEAPVGAQSPSPETIVVRIIEKFNKQIEERNLHLDSDTRTILLLDFLEQHKSGVEDPILGAGLA